MSRILTAAMLALALATPLFAGDIVGMPTGNTVKAGDWEANAIYWNRPMDTDAVIGELFYGVNDWLEIDAWYADVDNADSYWQLNAYLTLIKETAEHPSLILGCNNVTGEDWVGGEQFMLDLGSCGGDADQDDPSPFILGAYNLAAPAVPTWQTPLVRLHLGWGDKQYANEFFGGLQLKFQPNLGCAITNYNSMPGYMVTLNATENIELTGGILDGDTFWRAGGFWTW